MDRSSLLAAAALFCVAVAPGATPCPSSAGANPLAVVCGSAKQGCVVFRDPETLAERSRATLDFSPVLSVVSPQGPSVCVLGQRKVAKDTPVPGVLAVTGVDQTQPAFTVPLPGAPALAALSADGSMLACQVGQLWDPTPTVVLVDLRTQKAIWSVAVPPGPATLDFARDGHSVILTYLPGADTLALAMAYLPGIREKPPRMITRLPVLVYLDIVDGRRVAEIGTPRPVVRVLPSRDGSTLFLLTDSSPPRAPSPNPAMLYVFDTATRQLVDSLDVGWNPVSACVDGVTGVNYIVSRDAAEGRSGTVRSVEGRSLSGSAPVHAAGPYGILPLGGGNLLVSSADELHRLDVPGGRQVFESSFGGATMDLLVDSAGTRGWVASPSAGKVVGLDLRTGLPFGSASIGRFGAKLWNTLRYAAGSVGMTAAAHFNAEQSRRTWASGTRAATIMIPQGRQDESGADFGLMHLRRDGRYLYVVSTATNDVTIVETETMKPISSLGVGMQATGLMPSPGGDLLLVLRGSYLEGVAYFGVTVFDTRTNTLAASHKFRGWAVPAYTVPVFDEVRGRILIGHGPNSELMALRLVDGSREVDLGGVKGMTAKWIFLPEQFAAATPR